MKIIYALSTVLVVVYAQSSTAPATTTAPQSPTTSCLSACPYGDVNCQAICVGVPHPGEAQMGALTNCVAECDQGDGSKEASDKYGACRDACISSYIITSGSAAPGGAYTTAGMTSGVQVSLTSTTTSASSRTSHLPNTVMKTDQSLGTPTGVASTSKAVAAGLQVSGLFGVLLGGLAVL
jgi:hypothetical protein